ncbi:hypothetical protein E3983_04925 [Legionella israelensis]|uniref:Uncharacterized protein n=1 Tax=Legionella israelensis TaxID=454 RepID=A0AAX1EG17_9GAMM|nr:hypothetical protein [Legionella israelensis]QBR83754.1 hypothetical protein E3983_04925 [Legionella israelensis]
MPFFSKKKKTDLPMSEEDKTVKNIAEVLNQKTTQLKARYEQAGFSSKDTEFINTLNKLGDLHTNAKNKISSIDAFKEAINETLDKLPKDQTRTFEKHGHVSVAAYDIGRDSRKILHDLQEQLEDQPKPKYH